MSSTSTSSKSHSRSNHGDSKFIDSKRLTMTYSLEDHTYKWPILTYRYMTDEEKEKAVEDVDAVELFTVVAELNREIARKKLESHFLQEFLSKNDPRLLIGLSKRKESARNVQKRVQDRGSSLVSSGSATSCMTSKSTGSTLFQIDDKKKGPKYHLNYKAKAELCDKVCADIEREVTDFQAKAFFDIKMLRTRIEELEYRTEEAAETAKNFQVHFATDEEDIALLESGSEVVLYRKLRKFVNSWLKSARNVISAIRVRCVALENVCKHQRSFLLTKSDLCGILGPADFEQLLIKRKQLKETLRDKIIHLSGLKGISGLASLDMIELNREKQRIETESKYVTNKITDIIKTIGKMEKEAEIVGNQNAIDSEKIEHHKVHVEKFVAPSIQEYIDKKGELLSLEKEEKVLQRKLVIMNMKFGYMLRMSKRSSTIYTGN